ncbi:MAG TPA: hypothetical protein VIU61_09380 [Kofleriaceae bacterium]
MKKKSQKTNRKQLLDALGSQDARALDRTELEKVSGGYCGYWPEPCRSTVCSGCQGGTRR